MKSPRSRLNPAWKWIRSNVMNMTYRTEKVTVLRDWKLALLNYILQVLVVIWVIYSLFNEKTYIEREVPTGVVSSWGLGGSEYNDCLLYTSPSPTRLRRISYAVFCLKKKK